MLNQVIIDQWSNLKNTLVMRDFVDYLIENRVITLDYWISLKSKSITESERTEDFLSRVLKFDKQKFNHFLQALCMIGREDLVTKLTVCQENKSTKTKLTIKTHGHNSSCEEKDSKLSDKSRKNIQDEKMDNQATATEKGKSGKIILHITKITILIFSRG